MRSPEHITFDTSVLCRPFDRRFVMAAWELLGARVPVLPRVTNELYGVMSLNESEHWETVLEKQSERTGVAYSTDTVLRINEAVIAATRHWVSSELDEQEHEDPQTSGLRRVSLSGLDLVRVTRIAREIPAKCFHGPSRNGHLGDRFVIAEALVSGHQILASKNRSSIKRVITNTWLQEVHGLNTPLVQEADDVMQETILAHGHDIDRFATQCVVLAAWPEREVSTTRLSEIMERFFNRLEKSSFPDCSDAASRGWHSSHCLEYIESVKPYLPSSTTRATESRRVDLVRQAAEDAGWRRE